MTQVTYSNRSNAIRAARKALTDKGVKDPMSGVHFRLEDVDGVWTWHEIDVQTGVVAQGEMVEASEALTAALTPPTEAEIAAHVAAGEAAEAPALPKESREQRRLRLIREADERNKRGEKAPKGKSAKAEKAPRVDGQAKVDELLRRVQSPEGLTEPQLKAITGWTKFGGFYGAVKKAGLTMTRTKVDGVNVWHAGPAA